MRRPETIVLTLVGGVVAAGFALKACSPAPVRYRYSEQAAREQAQAAAPTREYGENEYLSGAGYYHPGNHRFHQYPLNFYSSDLGYFWHGNWHNSALVNGLKRSTPLGGELDKVRTQLTNRYRSAATSAVHSEDSHTSSGSIRGTRGIFGGFGGSGRSSSG